MTDPVDLGPTPAAVPDLWSACQAGIEAAIDGGCVEGELLRLVESQEQVATTSLVGDLAEQSVLEDLLEATKPPYRSGTVGMHYLLASPFATRRYVMARASVPAMNQASSTAPRN